jgi:hypothetical protein
MLELTSQAEYELRTCTRCESLGDEAVMLYGLVQLGMLNDLLRF